jgi:hypothetical protein
MVCRSGECSSVLNGGVYQPRDTRQHSYKAEAEVVVFIAFLWTRMWSSAYLL